MTTKKRARRSAVKQTAFVVPAASGAPRSAGFDTLVMQGTCVACKNPFKDHFNREGRFVGCNPNAKVEGDEFASAAVFVPPVIIPSAALTHLIQSKSGAIVVNPTPVNGTTGPMPVKFGRPADMFYPVAENLDPGYGQRLVAVFEKLAAHRETGITLRELVNEVGMPYSTVQSQVNRLISMKAAEKRSPVSTAA